MGVASTNPAAPVLEAIRLRLSVDPEWCVERANGFTWLPWVLPQTVIAEEPRHDRGHLLSRIFVVSDCVKGLELDDGALGAINILAGTLGSSGFQIGPDEAGTSALKLVASTYVHADIARWVAHFMPTVALMQSVRAHEVALRLERDGHGRTAVGAHPVLGTRERPDERLGDGPRATAMNAHRFDPMGPFAGRELSEALKSLQEMSECLLATGSESHLTAEFPCPVGGVCCTSLLEADTAATDPEFGRGVRLTLSLPRDEFRNSCGVASLLILNEMTNADDGGLFLRGIGGWHHDGRAWTHTAFYPDMTFVPGGLATWVRYEVDRAIWAAEQVYGVDWRHDLEAQRKSVLAEHAERVARSSKPKDIN